MTPEDIQSLLGGLSPSPRSLAQAAMTEAAAILSPKTKGIFSAYYADPVGYAEDVLRFKPWSVQREVLELCAKKKDADWAGKLAIGAGVGTGKTAIGGVLINWLYDCRGPCIIPTTAPSQTSVNDLLWKEVRLLRGRADAKWGIGPKDFIGPSAPEMRRSPEWWARGYVAAKGENFKGRHVERMYFFFDESCGLNGLYFNATKQMYKPDADMLWVCFYNPTDSASFMYQEISRPDSDWTVIEFSSMEHPNIIAGLKGEPSPIPAGVSLQQMESALKDDCDPIDVSDKTETDIEWPPGSGQWYKPGMSFEGHYLGRWPSNDESAIWSDGLWKAVTKQLTWQEVIIDAEEIPRIGNDVARFGDDKTCIHIVWGNYSVCHETKSGQNTMRTVGRIIELADEWASKANKHRAYYELQPISGKHLPIKVDDDGVGGAITDRLREQGYNVFAINAQSKPTKPNRYRDKRSELWFMTRDRARMGMLHLGLLPRKTLDDLRKQAKAPLYSLNSAGQREVEEKRFTKTRLGRSPDDFDASNLAWYTIDYRAPEIIHVQESPTFRERAEESQSHGDRRGWMGRDRRGTRRGLFRG